MDKIWFVLIDRKHEGPYSLIELERDSRLTPDTYVWKEGFPGWKKICDVPELKGLFKEPGDQDPNDTSKNELKKQELPQDEIVLEIGQPPPYLFWLLIAILAVAYFLFTFYIR